MTRTRWAAIGAAVTVALGAGGLGVIHATSPAGASAYVPIVPCRLADTRPDSTVGPRNTPIGANAVATYDGWGDVPGDCNLPPGTTGLQLNVTAVGATALTNLRLYPEGEPTPTASNLNPAPGQPPTPNSVAVTLDAATGRFHVFNRFGSVDVVLDVLGYYTDHDHDDRYYTKPEVDGLTADAPFLPYHPHVLDLLPFPADAWSLEFGWDHDSGDPTGCLIAPVPAPADTRINRVKLVYEAPAAAAVDVEIVNMRTTAGIDGPDLTTYSFASDAHAVTGGLGVRSTIVEHDINDVPGGFADGPIPGPGYDSILRVCTGSSITIRAVELSEQP